VSDRGTDVVLAIIQARMSSTRLPGKVLRPILGEPMLGRQIERLRRATRLTRLVVATSTGADDDVIEDYCNATGTDCFRGDLDNVLSRFLGAISAFGPAQTFVRLTADCPLADPELIDRVVASHVETGADYSYVHQRWSFPKGLDVEVCQTEVLQGIANEASAYDREHVTAFIYARPERFRLNAINRDPPLRYRWTVDTPEDFAFVTAVYQALYPANPTFTSEDILDWQARHPDRVLINHVDLQSLPA
jgi:spore coat polysaccharide biosynthesis protein SpsF